MVMVRRSLEAANAISAGNNISLIASATMIGLCRANRRRAGARARQV
jgi:hypothetical protein